MTSIESSVTESIARWAAETPDVRRVWVFGSHAMGTATRDSDLDVAVELEPVADSEETLTRWLSCAALWRSELQRRTAASIALQWFDPDGRTPTMQEQFDEGRLLIYERASWPPVLEALRS
jgi:predicted nucleotidyltransferase